MEQVAQQPAHAIARRTSKRWKWMILIFVVADFWGILLLPRSAGFILSGPDPSYLQSCEICKGYVRRQY
jgi:hypothetical protein